MDKIAARNLELLKKLKSANRLRNKSQDREIIFIEIAHTIENINEKIREFFSGKPIDSYDVRRICEFLNVDVTNIVDAEECTATSLCLNYILF